MTKLKQKSIRTIICFGDTHVLSRAKSANLKIRIRTRETNKLRVRLDPDPEPSILPGILWRHVRSYPLLFCKVRHLKQKKYF